VFTERQAFYTGNCFQQRNTGGTMTQFQHLSVEDAATLRQQAGTQVVDIRDLQSYRAGHIPGSLHLHNDNVAQFMAAADRQAPLVVCCYHGNSSQSAAQFLVSQGFLNVYSLDGGFAQWQLNYPHESETQG
jgi:thiosulfate sulfurtransferase